VKLQTSSHYPGARELSESCVSHNSGTQSGVWGRSP